MADYFALLTAAGLADVNASMLDGVALPLVDLAVGDGGGASYDPTGAEADLVNETARVPVEAVYRDPTDDTILIIEAVVPSEDGGFWVREVGVFTADGDLFAIGKLPPAYKPDISDGAAFGMLVRVRVKVAAAAQVQLVELSGDFYATRDWVRAHQDFVAVISATTTAPPGAPAVDAKYLIPGGATGVWAGRAGQLAAWRGALEGWQFVTAPDGVHVHAADTDATQRKVAGVWTLIAESPASALYLHANCL